VSSRFAPAPADSGSWQTYSNVLTQAPVEPPETVSAGSSTATEPHGLTRHAKK